jgi:hypothetical protein
MPIQSVQEQEVANRFIKTQLDSGRTLTVRTRKLKQTTRKLSIRFWLNFDDCDPPAWRKSLMLLVWERRSRNSEAPSNHTLPLNLQLL